MKAFMNGFLVTLGCIGLILFGVYLLERLDDEYPVIERLRDENFYANAWESMESFGNLALQEMSEVTRSRKTPQYDGNVVVGLTWSKEAVLADLRDQGVRGGKLRAAEEVLTYIEMRIPDALQDMYETSKTHGTGVSASITLAQDLLESGVGKSRLATEFNNHFGIKGYRKQSARQKIAAGRARDLTDDDFGFRSPAIGVAMFDDDNWFDRFEIYRSALDSYRRHSQLLTSSCTSIRKGCYEWIWSEYPVQDGFVDYRQSVERFAHLSGKGSEHFYASFETYRVPYYVAQAISLESVVYATSDRYAPKLAYLIETYQLWRLDFDLVRSMS